MDNFESRNCQSFSQGANRFRFTAPLRQEAAKVHTLHKPATQAGSINHKHGELKCCAIFQSRVLSCIWQATVSPRVVLLSGA